jgi:uncharacterized protein YlaI
MMGRHKYPLHGTHKVQGGKLMGTTDTDYFYFLCPECRQILQAELLETDGDNEGRTHQFGLYCSNCKLVDLVKIPEGRHGWEGGHIENTVSRFRFSTVNVDSIETDVLLDRWRYYLQGLPYTSLVNLLKDARQMGLNVCPLHRLKKKRKYNIRKQIEYAFVGKFDTATPADESEQFQKRVHNALKAYFCKHCGGRRAERRYNKGFDDCTCSR